MFQTFSSPFSRRLRSGSPFPAILLMRSAAALALATFSLAAFAQYPGRVQKNEAKKPPEPRAVSILEWVGDPGKPVASRIVPLSVFVDGEYQDGGLYLAQPAPLTVETDTLYELEQAGVPKGSFYVAGGEEVGGAWFGYGKWKPLAAAKPVKKLPPSKVPPRVVKDNDPDRPHFKGGDAPPASSGQSTGADKSTASGSAPTDPDKPTMHRRTDSGATSQSSSSGQSSPGGQTSSSDDPDKPTLHRRSSDSQSATGAGTAPDDPDRPHLKKQSAAAAAAEEDGSPVSSVNEGDPDRPKLSRGKPAEAQVKLEPTKLTGLPPDLQQMAAVSDPAVREQHVFNYPWPDPSEAAKAQAAVEQLAIQAVLSGDAATGKPIGPAPTPAASPAGRGKGTVGAKSTMVHGVKQKAPPVVLTEKDFHAYELSYSGGATLVLTAKAEIGPNNAGVTQEKYVTIIAQPDFNGDPQMRLRSVTDTQHLDITPRMRLVDAVDTDGDNRAELIFELRRTSDRQFAIYKVVGARAEQAFATESLPYVTPSHVAETKAN